ncbi:MAG: hypothetical protein ACMUHY_00120, partial [Thermoplasmatota archaeon]
AVEITIYMHPLLFHRTLEPLYLVASLLEISILSLFSILSMKEKVIAPVRRFRTRNLLVPVFFFGDERKRTLIGKECLELWRSGILAPIVIGFIAPLLAVYGLVYLIDQGLGSDLRFNVVFFGSLIGFFGVMTYSWLNNVELNETFDILPITVVEVIRVKLHLYFIFTTVISSVYIVVLGIIGDEVALIPLGLLVGLSTNFYVAYVTARLTGLKTNTMLLDAVTLTKFAILVTPPLILLVILSFSLEQGSWMPVLMMLVVSLSLLVLGIFFRQGIKGRWKRERFGL